MTRRDFELIACVIREHAIATTWKPELEQGWNLRLVENMGEALRTTNPNFDYARFIRACKAEVPE